MRKILIAAALLVAAGCGSSKNAVSVSTAGDQTANSVAAQDGDSTVATDTGSADTVETIPVKNLSDIPDECIKLYSQFLKQIEPIVSPVDWNKATMAQFESLGTQFQTESDALDAQTKASGCDKYSLQTSDPTIIKQLAALAATVAPGTVAFINFIGTFSATTDTTPVAAGDCDTVIGQIEPFLNSGKTLKDLTVAEVTKFYGLLGQVATACPQDKATAFYDRADVQAFANG